MHPDRRRQFEALYRVTQACTPEKRVVLLAQADPELRREVEARLAQETTILTTETLCGVGTHLGPYRLEAAIGAGGMGEVFRATDTRLYRAVAIKVLPRDQMSDPARKRRLLQEARAISALNHPNICALYDIGDQDGVAYLVMEYIEGETLTARLRQGPLPIELLVRYGLDAAGALALAHSRGIIHRDLKPSNLMVTALGIKVLDFGLAKVPEPAAEPPVTVTQGIIGTPAYMSPEQARGEPLDGRADIFSLGCVLYEAATGQRPFRGASTMAVLQEIVAANPPPPSSIQPDLPPEFDLIVERMLAKQRDGRYGLATELAASLEALRKPTRTVASTRRSEGEPSIAVLPFVNLSGDKENEYFGDGLAEEVINALVKIAGVRVIARTSSFRFRHEEDFRKIAEVLKVRMVLEGSIRRSGGRIRVTAQLIRVDDESHLWSERYDRELSDIFEIQDDIAQSIVEALKLKLERPGQVMVKRLTRNMDAYQLYLRGARHSANFDMAKAGSEFEQALAIDPSFALPHVGLAYVALMGVWFGAVPFRDAVPAAKRAALQAIELDESAGEAYAALGVVRVLEMDFRAAEAEFKCALQFAPESAFVRRVYAYFGLYMWGRFAEATQEVRRAIELDPLAVMAEYYLALFLVSRGMFDEASAAAKRAIGLDSESHLGHLALGWVRARQGRFAEGVEAIEKAAALSGRAPRIVAYLALAYGWAGQREEVRKLIAELHDKARSRYVPPGVFANAYFGLGEIDQTLEWLERCLPEGDSNILLFVSNPVYQPLQPHPRFQALLAKLNI
jgi:serine/threonine protein kinase/tetratricopeptide (TPR) repeat protein